MEEQRSGQEKYHKSGLLCATKGVIRMNCAARPSRSRYSVQSRWEGCAPIRAFGGRLGLGCLDFRGCAATTALLGLPPHPFRLCGYVIDLKRSFFVSS